MTLKQAHDAINSLLDDPGTRLCRRDHSLLAQALELLYGGAMENEESKQNPIPMGSDTNKKVD